MMQSERANAQTRADGPARAAVRPLEVGRLRLDRNLVLAPMAGVTNLPFRLIAREAGAALVFTETVSAKGLANGGAKSWRLVESSPHETPLAYQLFGGEAAPLGEATRMLGDRGAVWIDLNLGCPVKKFLRHGAGACLLRDPPALVPLLRTMRRALPEGVLSIKVRLGWDASSITAPEVARIAQGEGVDLVSVHGRTRAQLYSGSADRARIAEVVQAVRIPVLANGDVVQAGDALEMLEQTGAAGVMIGRGALANPWIFAQIQQLALGRSSSRPSAAERATLVERHMELMLGYFTEPHSAVHMLKKYLSAYAAGLRGASEFRDRVNRATELERVVEDARGFFGAAA
jgi:nifR3 family TIM-barrel protein